MIGLFKRNLFLIHIIKKILKNETYSLISIKKLRFLLNKEFNLTKNFISIIALANHIKTKLFFSYKRRSNIMKKSNSEEII